jgi:glycosyltransferase involved in cell wall biosynthesis
MVTIIIATYNRGHTLGRTIDSVLAQDLADWELIVVDDGSRDASAALVEGYADARIRLLRHETNRGVTAAKNTGLDHIAGDWFTTIDSDDEMVADALSLMVSAADRTGATSVTCNGIDSVTHKLTGTGIPADGWLDGAAAFRLGGVHWGITRTELLDGLRFDERLPWGEEALWTKVNHRARRYGVSRPLLIVHTEGADRLTVKNVKKRGVRAKLGDFRALGEDEEYLRILKETDPVGYARLRRRILVAKVLPFRNTARH